MLLRAAVRSGDASPADAPDAAAATAAALAAAGWSSSTTVRCGRSAGALELLAAVVALAAEVVSVEPAAGLPEVLTEFERRAAAQHAPVADGVTLASLHSAKGT